MTIGRASSPASASTVLGSWAAPVVDGCGYPWLRYRGARCHSLGSAVTGVSGWPLMRPAGRNGSDGRAA